MTLSGNAVNANGSVEVASDSILVYHVDGDDFKQLTFSDDVTLTGGTVLKTGTGKLKIKAAGTQFSAGQFAVDAGELDFYGDYNGNMEIQNGATLSPGNSVGNLTVYGNVVIDAGATGLFEFKAYNPETELQEYDKLTVADDGTFVLDANSVIKLYFENDDASLWAAQDAEYKLVSDDGFSSGTIDLSDLLTNFNDLFGLQARQDGLYLISLGAGPIIPPEPGTGVPEPSTWALMILGAAGLLYWRKRK